KPTEQYINLTGLTRYFSVQLYAEINQADYYVVKVLSARLWRAFCLMLGNQPSLTQYLLPFMQWLKPGFLPGQYRAQLVSTTWQTADMIELTLQLSKRWPGFVPGQHINVTL